MAYKDQSGSNYGTHDAGDAIMSREKMHDLAEDAFEKSAKAMSNAEIGKTTKLFGLFEVDAGLAAYIASMYNIASNVATNYLQPHTYDLTKKYASQAGMKGQGLNRVAAMTTVATTVAVKAGGFIAPVFEAYGNQRKQRTELAHKLAPILDDLKGKHSVGSLYAVKATDNEVIYVQRKRMGRIAHSHNFKAIVDLAINAGANLATDIKPLTKLVGYKGEALGAEGRHDAIINHDLPTEAPDSHQAVARNVTNKHEMKNLLGGFVGVTSSQIADRVAKSNEVKLQQTLQPYSAYEMIQELDTQVSSNPKASSYQVPKAYGSKRGSQKSMPLEEYVMSIFIQHQKDMADLSPDHTEIREALKDELAAAARPIAQSIRKGDMSALSLVRLVGEGKIIKNQGRAIASAEDVEKLIVRDAPKEASYFQMESKDYYKDASFTREDLKVALKALDGEEKQHLAAMIPDKALIEAGMSSHDVKAVRTAMAKDYERMIAEAVIGLDGKSDEELKKDGMAQKEIDFLHKAFEKIERDGLKAVHEIRSGPNNDNNGVERLITNVTVGQVVKGHKDYLGKIIKEGREKFDDVASERVSDRGRGARKEHGDEREDDADRRHHHTSSDNWAEDAYNATEKPHGKVAKMQHEGHLNGRHSERYAY